MVAARLDPADTFVELEDLYKGTNGILLRVGDVDNDGYPDLIFVTRRGGKSTARLFMNSQGVSDGTRSFSERFDGQLSGVDNVVSAAFLDLYEDVCDSATGSYPYLLAGHHGYSLEHQRLWRVI